jgi:hypothetical protein
MVNLTIEMQREKNTMKINHRSDQVLIARDRTFIDNETIDCCRIVNQLSSYVPVSVEERVMIVDAWIRVQHSVVR